MEWLRLTVLPALPAPFLLPLLGAIIGGEETILIISMLSAEHVIGFKTVLFFSFLGTLISDTLWFYAGDLVVKLERWRIFSKKFEEVAEIIRKISGKSHFRALMMTKFFYGTRILTLFHVRRDGMPVWEFIPTNAVVVAIWTAAIVVFGWLAGKGVVSLGILENIEGLIGTVLLVIIAFHFLRKWLNKRLLAWQRQPR
ncbi:MAG: hypothetical protein AAB518_01640 [Patescibacteria group bacterium]